MEANKTESEHKSSNRPNGNTPTELRDAWDDVSSSVGDLYRAADAFVSEQARERPHVTLGLAAGVGFLLGGGLSSRLGGTLLSMGTRVLAARFLEDWVSNDPEK